MAVGAAFQGRAAGARARQVGRASRAGGRRCAGQMTVELMVALPVMLAVAVVAVNALLFVGECSAFDRLARQAVCVHAVAPGYGQGSGVAAGRVQAELASSFDRPFESVEVGVAGGAMGYACYTATLRFTPTLFGRPFSGSVFGVAVPPVEHAVSMTVDPYRPGVVL